MHLLRSALLFVLSLALSGCVKLPAGRDVVANVELKSDDTGGKPKVVDPDEVLSKLATVRTPKFLGFFKGIIFDYETFDETVLARDLERIERFYRKRGYYEAKVTAARVYREEPGDPHVYVEIHVREGSPVMTEEVSIPGIEQLPFEVASAALQARKLEPGQVFDEDNFEESKKAITEALADRGYAFVKVTGKARVDISQRRAWARFQVEPGPLASYGKIRITGLKEIPEDRIRSSLRIREGQLYSHSDVQEAQDALINLGVFASVDVREDTTRPETRSVPIEVVLRESSLRAVRLGGGARVDPIRLENHLRVGWEDRNFLGGLRQFSIESRPAITYYPAAWNNLIPGYFKPLLESRIRADFRQRAFIEGRTTGILAAEYNIYPLLYQLEEGDVPEQQAIIGYHEVRAQAGLQRAFFRHHLLTTLSYNWQANFAFMYQEPLNPETGQRTGRPEALKDPVLVSFPELLTILDFRDDQLHPKEGFYVSNSLQVAGYIFGGTVSDVRIRPELRLYHSLLHKKITLAARATLGLLFPDKSSYGSTLNREVTSTLDTAAIKDQHKLLFRAFYSGGPNSNRGYAYRGAGPQGPVLFLVPTGINCAVEGQTNAPGCIRPTGGVTLWEASFEIRFPISGPVTMVTFADASNVTRNVAQFDFFVPHLSVGPGLRYDTPVGPLRVDIGYRVPGMQHIGQRTLPENEGVASPFLGITGLDLAVHLAFGEAF